MSAGAPVCSHQVQDVRSSVESCAKALHSPAFSSRIMTVIDTALASVDDSAKEFLYYEAIDALKGTSEIFSAELKILKITLDRMKRCDAGSLTPQGASRTGVSGQSDSLY